MTDTEDGTVERLVKSTERVRDLGEVFTPAATVKAMLDLLPTEMWVPHPSTTFLEPAAGDGNFLVSILDRKLDAVSVCATEDTLPAGATDDAVIFHALEALASIYAVDISVDNIVGGTPGHEIGARTRLLCLFNDWHQDQVGKRLTDRSIVTQSARWIINRNVQVGNMLAANPDGTPSGRDRLPLVEYTWDPTELAVEVAETTLGAVMSTGAAETTGVMSLFDTDGPVKVWRGPAVEVRKAPIVAMTTFNGETSKGNGRR